MAKSKWDKLKITLPGSVLLTDVIPPKGFHTATVVYNTTTKTIEYHRRRR